MWGYSRTVCFFGLNILHPVYHSIQYPGSATVHCSIFPCALTLPVSYCSFISQTSNNNEVIIAYWSWVLH